jgi:hypothetical protein
MGTKGLQKLFVIALAAFGKSIFTRAVFKNSF